MTHVFPIERRSRRVRRHSVARWASRVLLSVFFSLGMLGGTRPLVEIEQGPTVEVGEDGEAAEREEKDARIGRRAASRRGALAGTRVHARAPHRIDATGPASVPRRWQAPRRVPLPGADDDDTSVG